MRTCAMSLFHAISVGTPTMDMKATAAWLKGAWRKLADSCSRVLRRWFKCVGYAGRVMMYDCCKLAP